MLRAVLDTNVFVSALIQPAGAPGRLVALWLDGRFELILSPPLLDELRRTLEDRRVKKYVRLESAAVDGLIAALDALATPVSGGRSIPPTARDLDDDRVLAAALEGNADYVVTGNEDLLVLEQYEGIRIVTPRAFLTLSSPL